MTRSGLPWSWGATDAERRAGYPCDALVPGPALRLIRAVDVAAPAETAFRWACQLRLVPYSYDLVDNRGRRSPRTPGADDLLVGDLPSPCSRSTAGTAVGRSPAWACPAPTARFGPMACTYRVEPSTPAGWWGASTSPLAAAPPGSPWPGATW